MSAMITSRPSLLRNTHLSEHATVSKPKRSPESSRAVRAVARSSRRSTPLWRAKSPRSKCTVLLKPRTRAWEVLIGMIVNSELVGAGAERSDQDPHGDPEVPPHGSAGLSFLIS